MRQYLANASRDAVEEEQQAVGDIDARHTAVEIKGDEVQLWIHLLQFLFYTF